MYEALFCVLWGKGELRPSAALKELTVYLERRGCAAITHSYSSFNSVTVQMTFVVALTQQRFTSSHDITIVSQQVLTERPRLMDSPPNISTLPVPMSGGQTA